MRLIGEKSEGRLIGRRKKMRHDHDLFDLVPGPAFPGFGWGFRLWMLFCILVAVSVLGGLGYAVFWGLSIAERAVEQSETHQVDRP